jgi:putative phage-type endonuclease
MKKRGNLPTSTMEFYLFRRKIMINEIAYANKEEWLKLRRELGIGGSDAGAVIGFNPYKSAYTLWAEKTGKVPEFEGNLTTEVGSFLEEFVAQMFTKETGKKVRRKNRILVNEDYPFAFADVDRMVVGEDSILEIKTTNSFPIMKQARKGEFPEQYYAQVVHYLAVTGAKKAYLAILIECRDFKIFELERDEEEISALMNAEKEFWNLVQTDTPPTADCLKSTSDTLVAIYPTSNEESVSLAIYERELAEYCLIQSQIKEFEAMKDGLANKIKSYMQEASKGSYANYNVSWVSSERKTFDTKAFAKDNPDLDLSKYYKVSNVRTFKVSEKGGK